MKKLLLFCLISFAALQDDEIVSEYEKGPASNIKHAQSDKFCSVYFPYDEDNDTWVDDYYSGEFPYSSSECIDTLLWDKWDLRYYDRCCYVRFQFDGKMHGGCAPLTEDQYLDIAETMRKIEEGDPNIIARKTRGCKVYQLDCNSNYIKALTIASILLALFF